MPTGSCLCGNAKLSYEGEPAMKALCHCYDCRKISGGSHSVNLIVPGSRFSSSGTKTFSKTADGGNEVTSHFCPNCASTLYREGKTFGENKVVKAGILDDRSIMDNAKPAAELYAPERPPWQPRIDGAQDHAGMPA